MLVLTRKPGQSLYVGDDIKITLQGIRGTQARIGVEAPPNVRIYREEIYLQILEENKAASIFPGESSADLEQFAKAWKDTKQDTIAAFRKVKSTKPEDEE